jgi:ubiquinone/menaquinone biosynthesis C-methylase UbiE
MRKSLRTHKQDRLARIYDQEILPIWSQRFGRMMLRELALPAKPVVLDVACGTGYPSLEILRRLDEQGRIIAIDPSAPLLDVARRKAGELSGKRIFFRSEGATPRLSFASDVYDLVLCNLGLDEVEDPAETLREFARVTKPGGQVITTLTLRGTWGEFYDIYREVLIKHDKHDVLSRLQTVMDAHPEPETAIRWMEQAGLTAVNLEVEAFTLLFRSSREFFFAPLIEYGPLPAWKEVAGRGQPMQDVFWFIKEAIDAYFRDRAFAVGVIAGCLRGTKPSHSAEITAPVLRAALDAREEIEVRTGDIDVQSVLPIDDGDEEEADEELEQ